LIDADKLIAKEVSTGLPELLTGVRRWLEVWKEILDGRISDFLLE
jgi:hypothetical protein